MRKEAKTGETKDFDFINFVNNEKTKFYGMSPNKNKSEAQKIAEDLSRRLGRSVANEEILNIMLTAYKEAGNKNGQAFKVAFFKKLYAKIGTKMPRGYDNVGSCEGWDLVESLLFNLEIQGYITLDPISEPNSSSGSDSDSDERKYFGESAKYNDHSYEDNDDDFYDDDENAQFD